MSKKLTQEELDRLADTTNKGMQQSFAAIEQAKGILALISHLKKEYEIERETSQEVTESL